MGYRIRDGSEMIYLTTYPEEKERIMTIAQRLKQEELQQGIEQSIFGVLEYERIAQALKIPFSRVEALAKTNQ